MAYIYSALAIFIGSIFTASKQTKKLFIAPVLGAVVNTVANIILIPKIQGIGAAIATVAGYTIIMIVQMINTRTILAMNFRIRHIVASSICIIIEIIAILSNSKISFFIALILTICVVAINGTAFVDVYRIIKQRVMKGSKIRKASGSGD